MIWQVVQTIYKSTLDEAFIVWQIVDAVVGIEDLLATSRGQRPNSARTMGVAVLPLTPS